MENPDKRIIDFINEHHVLTLATSKNNKAYCANCFYAYIPDENCFVFTSDLETKHAQDAMENSYVAASIVLETKTVGKIQGIQLTGKMYRPDNELQKLAKKAYLKAFPYAALMKTTLWILKPNFIKMTHNTLGFGKKLIWGSLD
ncbi:MAG: pyridoxamine 5'-phosphate oxidase family protein [Bacteroidales bacterium]|nr:pyridoxamine 5'-phosphate oxidase family protein [Bacteroidales bacterium]